MNSVKPLQSRQNLESVIAEAKTVSPKYELLLLLGVETGLRISDILALRSRDVRTGQICVFEKKTGKLRVIRLSGKICPQIAKFVQVNQLADLDYLIFSNPKKKYKPLSRVQAWRVLKASGANVGLKGIGTHTMRKTFARERFKAEKDMSKLQGELNHKYMSTTLGYLMDADEMARAIGSVNGNVE